MITWIRQLLREEGESKIEVGRPRDLIRSAWCNTKPTRCSRSSSQAHGYRRMQLWSGDVAVGIAGSTRDHPGRQCKCTRQFTRRIPLNINI